MKTYINIERPVTIIEALSVSDSSGEVMAKPAGSATKGGFLPKLRKWLKQKRLKLSL